MSLIAHQLVWLFQAGLHSACFPTRRSALAALQLALSSQPGPT